MEWNELPEKLRVDTEVEIAKISNIRGIAIDELKKEFLQIFLDPSIKDYPPDARSPYSLQVLWSLHMRKQPTTQFDLVVPFGVREQYRTKDGQRRAEILAYMVPKGEKTKVVKELVCMNTFSNEPSRLKLLVAYKDITFQSRGQGVWLEIGSETKFKDPILLDKFGVKSPEDFFTRFIGIPKLSSLRQMANYRSKIGEDGYIDRFSQFIVEGIVVRPNKGLRKDQSPYANYVVNDLSLNYEEEVIEVAGEVQAILPSEITIWVPPRFLTYNVHSQLGFVGTITVDKKTHIPSMNAYYVYPAGIVRLMGEGEKK